MKPHPSRDGSRVRSNVRPVQSRSAIFRKVKVRLFGWLASGDRADRSVELVQEREHLRPCAAPEEPKRNETRLISVAHVTQLARSASATLANARQTCSFSRDRREDAPFPAGIQMNRSQTKMINSTFQICWNFIAKALNWYI